MKPHEQFEELAIRFGRNLYRLRRSVDLSQEELAARAAVHRTEIGLLENGRRVPRLDTIIKLGGGIEADPCKFLDGMEWVPSGHYKQGRFYIVGVPQDQREGSAER